MLTPEQRREMRERCDKATPGEWKLEFSDYGFPKVIVLNNLGNLYSQIAKFSQDRIGDAAFIAAARQDVPALLDEVERLTAENDAMRKQLKEWAPIMYAHGFLKEEGDK